MTALADFFHGSETTLGIFYPNHHLIAIFRDRQTAEHVAAKLHNAGFSQDDAIAAGGAEVLEFDHDRTGLAALLMKGLSSFFKTEQAYTEHDLEQARHGAGFVMVRCPTEKTKTDAWEIVGTEAPMQARYYSTGAIEHLAGDTDTD